MGQVLREIQRAIQECGKTRYAISKATGIDQAQLSRIMSNEMGLSLANLERLLRYLEMEVVIQPKQRTKRR